MSLYRAQQIIFTILAVCSIGLASVSACACAHHQLVVKEGNASSCHSSGHGEMAGMAEPGSPRSIDAPCNCPEAAPLTFAAAKKNDKQENPLAAAAMDRVLVEQPVRLARSETPSIKVEPPAQVFSSIFLTSLPPRAPPRA